MATRRRLTAFEVSFPDERDDRTAASTSVPSRGSSVSSFNPDVGTSSLGKRKGDAHVDGDSRVPKRRQLPKSVLYRRQPDEIDENDKLVIDGEDPYHEFDDGGDNASSDDENEEGGGHRNANNRDAANDKPIRELYEFYVFDPKHGNELVSLEALEQDDGVDRWFEAVGRVKAHFLSDEDDGQEDGLDDDADNEVDDNGKRRSGNELDGRAGVGGAAKFKRREARIHLSSILRVTVDYTQESEPFYIETMYAWYILMKPAEAYKEFYKHFYAPRRVAQLVISWALRRPQESFSTFLARFTSRVDMFGHTYVEQDLWDSLLEIQQAVFDEPDPRKISSVPFVKHLLRQAPPPTDPAFRARNRPAVGAGPRNKHLPKNRATIGNLDLAVMKPENQNSTHVTPRIAKLAFGLFREEVEVVGPPPPPVNKALVEGEKRRAYENLKKLYAQAKKTRKNVDYKKDDRIRVGEDMYKAVQIDGVVYNIGDVILTPRAIVFMENAPVPHLGDRIDQFFWFGRIHYIAMNNQTFHVEWFYHGSQTIMDEVAHPQELFLSNECGFPGLHEIAGKVNVVYFADPEKVKPSEYFCKFMYDHALCSFEYIDQKRFKMFSEQPPPNNCLSCALREEREMQTSRLELKNENGVTHGVAFAGKQFHMEDFVLYRAESGPCNIGYVVDVKFEGRFPFVVVRKVGRIADLEKILPAKMIKDERHLYLTDEKAKVPVQDLLDIIYAPCMQSFQPPDATLEDWLSLSYHHFYLRYAFPKLQVKSWKDRRKLTWQELYICTPCLSERLKGRNLIQDFLREMKTKPLPTLDLFAGVGAFSRGLTEGSGCIKVTHAIEISPSASKTFHRNSPEGIIYNQCANIMLRYAIKTHEGHNPDAPKQLFDSKVHVPPPPKPGDVKVIIAGFPCQTHSSLNMFKKADDKKSNLILTALSYMDFYKPIYGFFENVPGFVNFNLQADRENLHEAKGEIEKGGLKLLLRALIDMGYQVRFGHLQAAHYGTPQRRVRFFLIAAKGGHSLPEFPQPTHDYPDAKDHAIKYNDGESWVKINPVRATRGIAVHPVVTIRDAIGDLPLFDWEHPNPRFENQTKREERRKRAETIPSIKCSKSEPYCGFRGLIGYKDEPKTTYQYYARLEPTVDIQQYTKCLLPQKVVRVLNVPLRAGADYRDLPTNQLEWGVADPMSSVARLNYRRGVYGRLDGQGVFPTTVTNVDPTAKQSQVLHPYCHRMVTVRELARSQGFPDSFVFIAIGKNVITMHRQIGNAVPLPLAHALGRSVRKSLFTRWKTQREEAIIIEDDGDDGDIPMSPPQHHFNIPTNADDDDDAMDIYA